MFMQNLGLFILRVFPGFMMLTHGWPKLSNFSNLYNQFPDPLGLGSGLSLILTVGAEFGCTLLLILGVLTRLSATPLLITMLVAAFIVHGDDPFQKKELALMFATTYASIILLGPGQWAIGSRLFKHKWLQ